MVSIEINYLLKLKIIGKRCNEDYFSVKLTK